jgi:hypothetical protein
MLWPYEIFPFGQHDNEFIVILREPKDSACRDWFTSSGSIRFKPLKMLTCTAQSAARRKCPFGQHDNEFIVILSDSEGSRLPRMVHI